MVLNYIYVVDMYESVKLGGKEVCYVLDKNSR